MSIGNIAGTDHSISSAQAQGTNNTASLEQKIEQLKQQLEQIKQNEKLPQEVKDKRIANLENQIARLEQQEGQEGSKTSSTEWKKRFDTYEAQPPQQSAGTYQIAHDEAGRPVVQVDNSLETAQEPSETAPQREGEKTTIMKTTANTDKVDREIEKLKQTQAQLEQKIAAAGGQKDKEILEKQLAQVEAELRQKDNDTYRRQHMEITEQKVVSRIGE